MVMNVFWNYCNMVFSVVDIRSLDGGHYEVAAEATSVFARPLACFALLSAPC